MLINTISNISVAQECNEFEFNWKKTGKLPAVSPGKDNPGYAGPVTGVFNNLLLLAGGANFPGLMPWLGGKKKYYDEVYLFKKDQQGELVNVAFTAKLPFPVAYASSCTTPHGVFFAGGEIAGGLSDKTYLLKFNEDEMQAEQLPDLPYPVANAAVYFSEGFVYLAGGETKDHVSDNFICLNLSSPENGWQHLPKLSQAVSHSVMLIPPSGKKIYLIGGRVAKRDTLTAFYEDVIMFDVTKQIWQKKSSLPYPLAAGTGVAANGHDLYIFGGDKGIVFNQTENLIRKISQETDERRRNEINEEKIKLQTQHPGFSKEILSYRTDTDTWQRAGSLPFETPVTTTALMWNDDVIIPSGEIKAGVRTPYMITGKLK